MTIEEKTEQHYLLGYINHPNESFYCLAPIAYWIFNYSKFDPEDDQSDLSFRNGIYDINDKNISSFIEEMKKDEIAKEEIINYNIKHNGKLKLLFYINTKEKLLVSSFYYSSIEEYIPDDWKGVYGDPLLYVPKDIIVVWKE